jgi:hypothetical protein
VGHPINEKAKGREGVHFASGESSSILTELLGLGTSSSGHALHFNTPAPAHPRNGSSLTQLSR